MRGELDWIVMKALEKDRDPAVRDGQRAGRATCSGTWPTSRCRRARRRSGYRLRKFVRRNKRAVATAGAFGSRCWWPPGRWWPRPVGRLPGRRRAKVEAEAKNQLEFNLYLRNIPLAQVEALHFNWGGVEDLLKECPEHLRGWEFYYLKRRPNAALHDGRPQSPGASGANLDLAFSPDGRLLAGPGPNNSVTLWDLVTGTQLPQGTEDAGRARVLCVAFRPPDGRLLVSASSDGTLRFWDPETAQRPATR